jgi:hypothetical protein
MKYLLGFIVIVALIIIGPILTIWALNTLFPVLDIPYNINTWAAAVILGGLVSSGSYRSSN